MTPDLLCNGGFTQKIPGHFGPGIVSVAERSFLLVSAANVSAALLLVSAHIDLAAAVYASIASIIQHANRVDAQICARIQCRRAGCEIKIVGCGGHVDVQGIGELSMYVLRRRTLVSREATEALPLPVEQAGGPSGVVVIVVIERRRIRLAAGEVLKQVL